MIVVDRRGRLLADSDGPADERDFHGRPEIRVALAGRRDQRVRTSQSLGRALLATSVPILGGGTVAELPPAPRASSNETQNLGKGTAKPAGRRAAGGVA